MAVLTAQERARALIYALRSSGGWGNLTKPDISAAVDAADAWIDANAASYNSALPEPFRSTASLSQKTLIFCYVALRRAGLARVTEDN